MNPIHSERFASHHFELDVGEHTHLARHFRLAALDLLTRASEICLEVEREGGDLTTARECRLRILRMAIEGLPGTGDGSNCG